MVLELESRQKECGRTIGTSRAGRGRGRHARHLVTVMLEGGCGLVGLTKDSDPHSMRLARLKVARKRYGKEWTEDTSNRSREGLSEWVRGFMLLYCIC